MLRRTGEGWVNHGTYDRRAILYLQNFDIDGTEVKPLHQKALKDLIVPRLEDGCSITLVGMADRLGSYQYNLKLSARRADSVLQFLRRQTQKGFRVQQQLADSERRAASRGMRDNTRGDEFRAVAVVLWPNPQPRKIDPKGIKLPPTPGVPIFSNWGPIFDGAAGFVALIAAFSSAAFVTLLDGFFGVVGPIIAGIVALAEADRNARFNGFCQGVWLGMQALADQFKDHKLDQTPLDMWPRMKLPVIPHQPGDLPGRFGELVHKGRQEGAQHVFEYMRKLDMKPQLVAVNGVRQKRKVGGRLMLRALSYQKGDRVAEWMQGEVQKELKKRGIGPWPLGGPRNR